MLISIRTFAVTLCTVGLLSLTPVFSQQGEDSSFSTAGSAAKNNETAETVERTSETATNAEQSARQTEQKLEQVEDAADNADNASQAANDELETNKNETTKQDKKNINDERIDEINQNERPVMVKEQPNTDKTAETDDKSTQDDNNVANAEQKNSSQLADNNDRQAADENEANLSQPPAIPQQARQGNNNAPRGAQWRMVQRQGQWWYYTPDGQWKYHRDGRWNQFDSSTYQARTQQRQQDLRSQDMQPRISSNQTAQPYSTGYRGEQQSQQSHGHTQNSTQQQTRSQAAQLRYDRCGRAFICENGRRVYVQVRQSQSTDRVNQASYNEPTPVDSNNEGVWSQESSNYDRSNNVRTRNSAEYDSDYNVPEEPHRPTPVRDEMRSTPPATPYAG